MTLEVLSSDGDFRCTGWIGWEGYEISGRAEMIDGYPAVTSISLRPVTGARTRLTVTRLHSLPLLAIATKVIQLMNPPQVLATSDLENAVAQIWNSAYQSSQAPRAAVAEQLGMSVRTADRRIAEARAAGIITAPLRGGRARRNRPD